MSTPVSFTIADTNPWLAVNGITVPTSPGGAQVKPERIGEGRTRSFNGTGRVNFQSVKQHLQGTTTTPITQAEAWAFEKLFNGEHDCFHFGSANGLYSDKSNNYTSKADATQNNSSGKWAGRLTLTATTGTITYPTNLGSSWTVFCWSQFHSLGFRQYTQRSDGVSWDNGVQGTALSFISVSSGSLTLVNAGAFDRDFSDVVVLPAVIPDTWAAQIYTYMQTGAYPVAPRLYCSGDFHISALTCLGEQGAAANVLAATSGSLQDNLRAISFDLMER